MGRANRPSIDFDLGLAILSTYPRTAPRSLTEIAAYCGCSRENIRLIERRALRKLRLRLEHDPALMEAVETFTKQK